MQIQNDFGHIMIVLYRHRFMQMFGFTEVLLSTYIQFTFTLHLYLKYFKKLLFSTNC